MTFSMRMLEPWKEASAWSGAGVVPVCTAVLHRPTERIAKVDSEIRDLARHMLVVMKERHGIGLAANQVGAPLRMFVHAFPEVAPPVILNPVLLRAEGAWEYREGCLSLKMPDTASVVMRPKKIRVRGELLDGSRVDIVADELFSRVVQHEIDHLDGIEYVQRLTEPDRTKVYDLMASNGIDTSWMPPVPYEAIAPPPG